MPSSRVTFTLNHLVGAINHSADQILRREFGMTFSQFLFLVSLQNSGRIRSGELAQNLGVSAAAVSKRLDWFSERQLLTTGEERGDTRRVMVEISPGGESLTTAMSDLLEKEFRAVFSGIEGVDLDRLNDDLMRVLAHLETLSPRREAA